MPIKIRKHRGKELYTVYNMHSGEIHSHATTKKNALAQKRLLEHYDKLNGGNLFNDIKHVANKAVNTVKTAVVNPVMTLANKVINGRSGFSPNMQSFMNAHGNEIISKMVIVKHPVSLLLTGAMNAISGNFNQRMTDNNINKVYHLMLYITTNSNTNFILEKVEEVRIVSNYKFQSDDTQLPISSIPSNLTLNQLLDKARNRI